jgi:hypothetical protein
MAFLQNGLKQTTTEIECEAYFEKNSELGLDNNASRKYGEKLE